MSIDDIATNREAKARTIRLGGDERVEYLRQNILRNCGPGIRHFGNNMVSAKRLSRRH